MNEKKTKFYAVQVGRVPGVYTDLEEYRKQVDSFIGARGRVFKNEQDALNYAAGKMTEAERKAQESRDMRALTDILDEESQKDWDLRWRAAQTVAAYIDGSHDDHLNKCGYGVVLTTGDGREIYLYGLNKKASETGLRSTASELSGCVAAVEWATKHKVKNLIIVSDCSTVANLFVDDQTKSHNFTKSCWWICKDAQHNGLNIEFQKIAAHVGNPYGDMADALSRYALGKEIREELSQKIVENGAIDWELKSPRRKKDSESQMKQENYKHIRKGRPVYQIVGNGTNIIRGNVAFANRSSGKISSIDVLFDGKNKTIKHGEFGRTVFLYKSNAEQMRKKMLG